MRSCICKKDYRHLCMSIHNLLIAHENITVCNTHFIQVGLTLCQSLFLSSCINMFRGKSEKSCGYQTHQNVGENVGCKPNLKKTNVSHQASWKHSRSRAGHLGSTSFSVEPDRTWKKQQQGPVHCWSCNLHVQLHWWERGHFGKRRKKICQNIQLKI